MEGLVLVVGAEVCVEEEVCWGGRGLIYASSVAPADELPCQGGSTGWWQEGEWIVNFPVYWINFNKGFPLLLPLSPSRRSDGINRVKDEGKPECDDNLMRSNGKSIRRWLEGGLNREYPEISKQFHPPLLPLPLSSRSDGINRVKDEGKLEFDDNLMKSNGKSIRRWLKGGLNREFPEILKHSHPPLLPLPLSSRSDSITRVKDEGKLEFDDNSMRSSVKSTGKWSEKGLNREFPDDSS